MRTGVSHTERKVKTLNNRKPESLRCLARREFLRKFLAAGTIAAVFAPAIVPSSVFGVDAPSNRITLGMVGMGRQAYYSNMKTFLGFNDVQVLAVNDVDTWRL